MKKNLLFLTLVLFIYWCSTPIQNTTTQDIVKQDTRLNEPNYSIKTESIAKVESEFIDKSQETPSFEEIDDIVSVCPNNTVNCLIDCDDWNITKKSYIIPYKNWYIGFDYWWNWWCRWYFLTYKSLDNPCDETISNTDEIFIRNVSYPNDLERLDSPEYPDNKLYYAQWWWSWIPIEKIAKHLNCKPWKPFEQDDSCKKEVDRFMYNLIIWNEENEYFTQWMEMFKKNLDNNIFTTRSFRFERWKNCNKRFSFESLLQENGNDNRTLSNEVRKKYSKIQNERIHKCLIEYQRK